MKTTHLLAGLMVIAAMVVDLVLAHHLPSHPDVAFMLLWGLSCGQLALLVVWNVWGQAAWLVRWLTVLTAAAWKAWPLAAATNGHWMEWVTLSCLFVLCVSLPFYVARAKGWTLRPAGIRVFIDRATAIRPAQFSLADLLSLLTLTGLAFGLRSHVAFPWRHLSEVACYGVCLTAVAAGSVWTIASQGDTWRRLGVLSGICLAAGWLMFAGATVRDAWFFTLVAFAEALVICLGLSIMQSAGVWFSQKSCRSM